MRYMWICSKSMPPSQVILMLEDRGSAVVTRVLNTHKRACWVFFTNYLDWQFAVRALLNDDQADHWSITACNKQYVTNEVTGKYLGALAEVQPEEAHEWVLDNQKNWFLRDPTSDKVWMPVNRNPNKIIPTGDSGFCLHCGAEKTPPKHTPQHRPWPLNKDA